MPGDSHTRAVLVTGATGFIGREVVRHLLASGQRVIAIARPHPGMSARTRVIKALGEGLDSSRLGVVEADLTRLNASLPPLVRHHLRETVETIIHCAGNTVFYPDDMETFRRGHIAGPLDLLHALQGRRLRRWAQLSTAYVCGRRTGVVSEQEADLEQEFHNPYECIKLKAEIAIARESTRLGVEACILRPSIVVGAAPDTTGGHPANLFFAFLRMAATFARLAKGSATARLCLDGAPDARFNIVSIAYVSQAIVALAQHPDAGGGTFHLVVRDAPTQEAMRAMIAEHLGLQGLAIVDSQCIPLPEMSPLERKVARLLAGYRDYMIQDVQFDDRHARRLLDRCGIPCPTLGPADVHRLIGQALTTTSMCLD